MPTAEPHSSSRLASVARAELWAAALAVRPAVVATALALLYFTWGLTETRLEAEGPVVIDSYWVSFPAVFLSLAVALSIWRHESPGRRAYFHSLPVGRAPHHLLRDGAGWVWTMVGTGVLYLWPMLAVAVSRGTLAAAEPWQWAAPIVVATVAFLFAAALTTALNAAGWWLLGGIVLFPLLAVRSPVIAGRYGVATLVGVSDGPPAPPFLDWLVASVLWLGVGAAALCFAATIRRDS